MSVNVFGFVIGVLIGGYLLDKYGWKVIYIYDMFVYMLGMIIVVVLVNFLMLLVGFLIIGIVVGVGVFVLWIYILEMLELINWVENIGIL